MYNTFQEKHHKGLHNKMLKNRRTKSLKIMSFYLFLKAFIKPKDPQAQKEFQSLGATVAKALSALVFSLG